MIQGNAAEVMRPWGSLSLKEKRARLRMVNKARREQGKVAAQRLWHALGLELTPEMLRVMEASGAVKKV